MLPKDSGDCGGVASGKSSVAHMFGQLGARIVDADRLGHELLSDPEVMAAARHRWGSPIFDGEGRLDRQQIAARVFAPGPQGDEDRKFWENVLHPRIRRAWQTEVDRADAEGPAKVLVLDAALLLEAGWAGDCDAIVFVDVPSSVRRQRAVARGWSEDTWQDRERAQWDLPQKRSQADFVIDNSGSSSQTYEQVQNIWNRFSDCAK